MFLYPKKKLKDYIKIEYKDGGVLYVPVTSLEYVKKYRPYFEGKKLRFNNHPSTFYYDVLSHLSAAKNIQIWAPLPDRERSIE